MGTAPQSEGGAKGLDFSPEAGEVREQLRRLVSHPLFTNSRRYPVLLSFAVEQTLLGNSNDLKERTIGIEAFGREPDYDVNLDPIVRTTAAEVRKRLTQYYYAPDHKAELVIELPVGSYVPSFREPRAPKIPLDRPAVEMRAREVSPAQLPEADVERPAVSASGSRWLLAAGALLVAAGIGFGIGRVPLGSRAAGAGSSNMDRFWQPITATAGRITYCLGVPTDSVDVQIRSAPELKDLPAGASGSLNVYDVITLARSIEPLVPKNGQFRVLAASSATFPQLREGPFVLIGAFDNPWTMRITQDLPFGFEIEDQVRNIVDRTSTPNRKWALQWQVPFKSVARDYAIVARLHDKITGQPVIVLGGILGEGTEAASEVVSNPTYLNALLNGAPRDWDQRNLEAIVEAGVMDGHPGPPHVLAVKIW